MFKGLDTSKSTAVSTATKITGEPCIHKHHYRSDLGFRQGSTQACLECMTELIEPKINLCPDTLRPLINNIRLSFWSKVDISALDDCWKYTHRSNKKRFRFMWKRPLLYNNYNFHPIRVATWLSWGDVGLMATRSLCSERMCVNPLHQFPACITPEQVRNQDINSIQDQVNQLKNEVCEYQMPVIKEESSILVVTGYEKAWNRTMIQKLNV